MMFANRPSRKLTIIALS